MCHARAHPRSRTASAGAVGHAGHEHAGHDHGTQPVAAGENFDVELDITEAVRATAGDATQVLLKLVAVDVDGNEVAADSVRLDEIEIVVD